MDIHNRIKMLRLLRGLTQEELAFRAEVPRPSLGNYEQGTYVPRDKSLESLADILGVEPGYLRYGSPVVSAQVWQPDIPTNARRKLETIHDIVRLLPEFITENRFDAVISRPLGGGERLFYFGRKSDYSCLLLAVSDLEESALNTIKGLVPVEDLLEHPDITVASFSAKDLDLQAQFSG
jgi:transcriptional regulator with XRE-family HTH domain